MKEISWLKQFSDRKREIITYKKKNISGFISVMLVILNIIMLTACGNNTTGALIDEVPIPDFAHDTPVGEITSSAMVDQNFVSPFSKIDSIDLYGATYMRENTGTVEVSIYTSGDKSDETIRTKEVSDLLLIANWKLDASAFEDNTLISLLVDDADTYEESYNKKLKGKECLIVISSPDCEAGSSVTFWSTQEDVYEDGCVRIGGYEQYNDLWFNVYGTK